MLRILGNWKVTLELVGIEFEERESMMAFSQAFLEWKQTTKQQGLEQGLEQERSLIIRQLIKKVGPISEASMAQIQSLSMDQAEALGEALFRL